MQPLKEHKKAWRSREVYSRPGELHPFVVHHSAMGDRALDLYSNSVMEYKCDNRVWFVKQNNQATKDHDLLENSLGGQMN